MHCALTLSESEVRRRHNCRSRSPVRQSRGSSSSSPDERSSEKKSRRRSTSSDTSTSSSSNSESESSSEGIKLCSKDNCLQILVTWRFVSVYILPFHYDSLFDESFKIPTSEIMIDEIR